MIKLFGKRHGFRVMILAMFCALMHSIYASASEIFDKGNLLSYSLLPDYNYDEANLTVLGIVIGNQDTLKILKEKLGDYEIISADDKHSPELVCYSSLKDKSAIVFEVHNTTVEGFTLYRDRGNFKYFKRCKDSNKINANVSTKNGIGLNFKKNDLAKIGPFSEEGYVVLQFIFKKRFTQEEIESSSYLWRGAKRAYWHVSVRLEFFSEDGSVLNHISIRKDTVN